MSFAIRLLFAAALCLASLAADATRWISAPLAGASRMFMAGREDPSLIVLRDGMDPVRSLDGGATWTPFQVAGKRPVEVYPSSTHALTWYAIAENRLYRTDDAGQTWTERSAELSPGSRIHRGVAVGADPDLLYALELSSTHSGLFSTTGLYRSTDGGLSWIELDYVGLSADAKVVASPADAGTVYVVGGGSETKRSVDRGGTWNAVTRPDADPASSIHGLVLDGQDPAVAYARQYFSTAIWTTRDGGLSWTRSDSPEIGLRSSLVADPLQRERLYLVSGSGGVHESRDGGATWATVESAEHALIGGRYEFAVGVREGRREALAAFAGRFHRLDLVDGALELGSDLWWNPAQSGWGLSITQHASNRPFMVWYAYGTAGEPVWRVMPGGTWEDRTLRGEMFETTGPAFFREGFDPARVQVRRVGVASLRFDDHDRAAFSWQLADGTSGQTSITRQVFGGPAAPVGASFADLWWNASESGWGIAIAHQGERIFAAWFAYGDDGKPLWIVMPDAPMGYTAAGVFMRRSAEGAIYTTRGPSSAGPFDPSMVAPIDVGTAKIVFSDAQRATLTYTAFGRTETRAITRQPF